MTTKTMPWESGEFEDIGDLSDPLLLPKLALEKRIKREERRGFKVEPLGEIYRTAGSRGWKQSNPLRDRVFNTGPHARVNVRITGLTTGETRQERWWYHPDRNGWKRS